MFLLFMGLAHASGIMRPPTYTLVDEGCGAVDLEKTWPTSRPVQFAGLQAGATSPPGGPVTHHTWPVLASGVVLRRADCETWTGQWVSTERSCGLAPVLAWHGELEPGAQYAVDVGGSTVSVLHVEGDLAKTPCPTASSALAPTASRSISTVTRAVSLPPGVVTREGETTRVDALQLEAVLGYPGLQQVPAPPEETAGDAVAPPPGSVRLTRTLDVEERGQGEAVRCVARESVAVELVVDGVSETLHLASERVLSDNPWACPPQ